MVIIFFSRIANRSKYTYSLWFHLKDKAVFFQLITYLNAIHYGFADPSYTVKAGNRYEAQRQYGLLV